MLKRNALILSLLLLLSGCSSTPHLSYHMQTAADLPYRLDSGDSIRLIVFGEPNLTNTYKIGNDGYISMPLIGGVPARGMTPFEMEKNVANYLRRGFIRNPDVTIEVALYRPFYIYGRVNRSGQYDYAKGLTIESAVARAAGFQVYAKKNYAILSRKARNGVHRARVPLHTRIMPGDTIIIE